MPFNRFKLCDIDFLSMNILIHVKEESIHLICMMDVIYERPDFFDSSNTQIIKI